MHEATMNHDPHSAAPRSEQFGSVLHGEMEMPQESPMDLLILGVDPENLTEDEIQDLIDRHPAAQETMQQLRAARASRLLAHDAEAELVRLAREQRTLLGDQIKERLGLNVESDDQRLEREEQERVEELAEIQATITGDETDDELMIKYRLVDEDGKLSDQSISSPLFMMDTRFTFRKYLRFAANYDAFEQAQIMTGTSIRNAQHASNVRGEAHNAVADLVARDLGITDQDVARRIVTKMRESIIPGSGEKENYATLIRGQKFAEEYASDGGAMADRELRSILKKPENN